MKTVGEYLIEIVKEYTYTSNSADNAFSYDFEYFDESDYKSVTVLGIKIFEDGTLLKSAIIGALGGGTGYYENSAFFEEDKFIICCADSVLCLSIPDLTLLWRTKADFTSCFEVFKYQKSYIVYGEVFISRLEGNGDITWQFSGEDIFVNLDKESNFLLEKDCITVSDFNGKVYRIDYDGNSCSD